MKQRQQSEINFIPTDLPNDEKRTHIYNVSNIAMLTYVYLYCITLNFAYAIYKYILSKEVLSFIVLIPIVNSSY